MPGLPGSDFVFLNEVWRILGIAKTELVENNSTIRVPSISAVAETEAHPSVPALQ